MTPQTAHILQTYASLVLTGTTVLTLFVLSWYTFETFKLRKLAQDQTAHTAHLVTEAQRQNELVEATFRELEETEIRRQKVECVVALFGLRFVLSNAPALSPESRVSGYQKH